MTDRKTFFVFTSGCKANQWDSHVLADRLEQRVSAGPRGTGRSGRAQRLFAHRQGGNGCETVHPKDPRGESAGLVALVGCHAQAYPVRDFGADLVLGQAEKFDILRHLTERGRFVARERHFPMEETG